MDLGGSPTRLSSIVLSFFFSFLVYKMRFEGNGNVKIILHLKGFHFTVKGIDFPFDRVLHVLPNEHDGVKYFPNFILI